MDVVYLQNSTKPWQINRNGLWCQVIADALSDMGVVDIVMHSGARNVTLALAMNEMPQFRMHIHIDERSGTFMATTLAQTTRAPVVVSTTTGSAIANCLPALSEASKRNLPVILISGDRNRGTRHINVTQSSDQTGICSSIMRAQHDLPDPLDAETDLIALRRTIIDAVNQATSGLRPGPVQINMPLWGGACATELDKDWYATVDPEAIRRAVPANRLTRPGAQPAEIERALHRMGSFDGKRGLIFCGPDSAATPEVVDRLAALTGFPVIADAASGIRKKGLANLVTVSDALGSRDDIRGWLSKTEFLLRLGRAPMTPIMTKLAKSIHCPTLRICHADPGPDFWTNDAICLRPIDLEGAELLARRIGRGDAAWLAQWMEVERHMGQQRREVMKDLPWGDVLAAGIACNWPGYDFIHIGNSLATRQSNLLSEGYAPGHREFIARGMAGTDGALGMFLGEMLGTGARGMLLIGDHSTTHDIPALASQSWRQVRGAIVLINNSGAGIFDTLACAQVEGYRDIMRNQPFINFRHIAAAFDLDYRRCVNAEEFRQALEEGARSEGVLLIEAVTTPETTPRDLPEVLRRMAS